MPAAVKPQQSQQARAKADADLAATLLRGGDPVLNAPITDAEAASFTAIGELITSANLRLRRRFVIDVGCPPEQAKKVPDPKNPGKVIFSKPDAVAVGGASAKVKA